MDENKFDKIFSDENLKKAIREVKLKSTIRTIIISLVVALAVFIILTKVNVRVTQEMSERNYGFQEDFIKLTVPNGYISKSFDTFGFFNGRSTYTISKQVGNRTVKLEDRDINYGYFPQLTLSRGRGGVVYAGEWSISQWENGYSKMIFFHPEISYKEYKNDLNELDNISADKIIEIGISFDKPYNLNEMNKVLPNINKSWYWIDIDNKDMIDLLKKQAKEYDSRSSFINEFETVGFSVNQRNEFDDTDSKYTEFLELLKRSNDNKYNRIYKHLISEGYSNASNAPAIGAIVYGTKDDLKKLIGNPHIKASSFGVIINRY